MGLFSRKKTLPKTLPKCPFCGDPVESGGHYQQHVYEVKPGRWTFVCAEGVANHSWPEDKKSGPRFGMEIHAAHEHGVYPSKSVFDGNASRARSSFQATFPNGLTFSKPDDA